MFELLIRILLVLIVIEESSGHYTNTWAVEVDGGVEEAKKVAVEMGFQYVNEIIPGFHAFKHHQIMKRSLRPDYENHSSLKNNPKVLWTEQQRVHKRVKRDLTPFTFNDPLWPDIWYMHSSTGNDMRVLEVYSVFNITGRGVKVTILDDGLEKNHTDLVSNYDAGSSFDVNDNDNDPQPTYDRTDENRHGTRCAGEVASMANNGVCGVGIAYNAKIGGVRMLDGDVTDMVEARSLGLNPNHIDIYSISWGPEDNGATVDGPGRMAKTAIYNGITQGRRSLGNIFVWASGNGGLKGDSCSCDGYCNSIYTITVSSATESGSVPWYSEPCANTLASTYSSGSQYQRSIVTTDLRGKCTSSHTGTSATAPLVAGICALVLEANPRLNWRDIQYIIFLSARQANLQADDWVYNGVERKVSHHFGYGLMDAHRMVELAFNWTTVPMQHKCSTNHNKELDNLMIDPNTRIQSTIVTNGCQVNNNNSNNNNRETNDNNSNDNNSITSNSSSTEHDTRNNTNSNNTTTSNNNSTTNPDSSAHPSYNNTGDSIYHLEHVECVVTLKVMVRGQVELFLTSPQGTTSHLLIKRSSDRSDNGFVRWSFMSTHSWGEDPKGEWTLGVNTYDSQARLIEWYLNFYGVATRPQVYDSFLPFYRPSPPPIPTNNNNSNINSNINSNNRSIQEKPCYPSYYFHHGMCVSNCPYNYYRYDHLCLSCDNHHLRNDNPDHSSDCTQTLKSSRDYSFHPMGLWFVIIVVMTLVAAAIFGVYLRRLRRNRGFHLVPQGSYNNANTDASNILLNNSANNKDSNKNTMENNDISKVPLLLNSDIDVSDID